LQLQRAGSIIKKMECAVEKFKKHGGIVETGVGNFGDKGPILSYPTVPQETIPYAIGRIRCEELLNY
jgi:hypothetical protein